MKSVKLQHRTYLGADKKTKYTQHRVNIPDHILRKLNWTDVNQIVLNVNTKKKSIILVLKTNNEQLSGDSPNKS